MEWLCAAGMPTANSGRRQRTQTRSWLGRGRICPPSYALRAHPHSSQVAGLGLDALRTASHSSEQRVVRSGEVCVWVGGGRCVGKGGGETREAAYLAATRCPPLL